MPIVEAVPRSRQPKPTPANAIVVSESHGRQRRMSALDWAARIVEENGRELAESFLSAARKGDWRASEALMNRIYGKPDQAVLQQIPPDPTRSVIASMSFDEKLELLRRLQDGEFVSNRSRSSVVEPTTAG